MISKRRCSDLGLIDVKVVPLCSGAIDQRLPIRRVGYTPGLLVLSRVARGTNSNDSYFAPVECTLVMRNLFYSGGFFADEMNA